MTITVPDLEGFDRSGWDTAADSFDITAAGSQSQADSLRQSGAAVRSSWRDMIGGMIADRYEEQADLVENQGNALPPLADALVAAANQMDGLRVAMAKLKSFADANDIVILWNGVSFPEPRSLLDPTKAVKQIQLANSVRANAMSLLRQATVVDLTAASVLAAALGIIAPPFDAGPLDLTDDGIREQVGLSAQGGNGFCAWLSPLMSLGRSNPDFIRKHIVWDPVTQKYTVTIYDRDTGQEIKVTVDPRDVEDNPADAYTGEPNFLSIYTDALRQTYPDIDSSNFELSGKIILGKDYDEGNVNNTSFSDIRATLATDPPGSAMVATTGAAEDQPDGLPDHKRLYGGHAYSVVGFTDDGQIILENPHGPAADSHRVTLTEDEYKRWLNGVMQWPAQ